MPGMLSNRFRMRSGVGGCRSAARSRPAAWRRAVRAGASRAGCAGGSAGSVSAGHRTSTPETRGGAQRPAPRTGRERKDATTTLTLPPLPEQECLGADIESGEHFFGYTADQLHADRIAVAAAVIDACVKACDDIRAGVEPDAIDAAAIKHAICFVRGTIRALQIEESK
jgi:hypothetical protein